MGAHDKLLVYGARYADATDALQDLQRLKELHQTRHLGRYDAAVVRREENGAVWVANTDASERGTGAWTGAVVGGVLGVVFPPSAIASAALGAGVGAVGGQLSRVLTNEDARQLGELLEPGQTGLIVVTDGLDQAYRPTLFANALTERSITVTADEDVVVAVDAEAKLGR